MLGMGVLVNDKLIVEIPTENREWGYNPCPDGTIATVIGFGEIEYNEKQAQDCGAPRPGIYVNRCWFRVMFPDGRKDIMGCWNFKPFDKDLYEERLKEWRKTHDSIFDFEFIRDLDDAK